MNNKVDFMHLVGTVFGLGHLPVAPGTWGSLAGLGLCLLLHDNPAFYMAAFAVSFILGLIASHKLEKRWEMKDPSSVVIDEFASIFIAFLLVPITVPIVITGFILYRAIDVIKLPPMRSLEKLKGGWGIMLDDLMGAIYTNLILQILIALNIFQ